MSVSTLSNFIAAVNATTGKSGSVYNASSPNVDGAILISRAPSASAAFVGYLKVFYSTNPDTSVVSDLNPSAAGVIIRGVNGGLTDVERYCDAQAFINSLAAN